MSRVSELSLSFSLLLGIGEKTQKKNADGARTSTAPAHARTHHIIPAHISLRVIRGRAPFQKHIMDATAPDSASTEFAFPSRPADLASSDCTLPVRAGPDVVDLGVLSRDEVEDYADREWGGMGAPRKKMHAVAPRRAARWRAPRENRAPRPRRLSHTYAPIIPTL